MPNYARFLKDIVSGRRSCDVVETVNLTESCSAIIMNKMPPKLGNPGNFSIPCAINRIQIDNALCDLGASVSLMPYTVYQRLDIGELLPTNITLQLADRSIKFPKGKVKDVPLRVGKFVIPVDFVVLDMDEDVHIPIILGRPFLATSGALIDVKSAKITLKVGEEVLEFDLNASMKYPSSTLEKCMKIDTIDCVVNSMHEHLLSTNNALESVLLNKEKIGDQSKEMALYEELLDENVEGKVEQACMGITLKHAMEISPTMEGKGVPMVELKPLPSHLRYEFLGPNSTFPVIVNVSLNEHQTRMLCGVLRNHQNALGYTLDNLKGISPAICMHHITLEKGAKPSIERQRKLNPQMGEVVKKEITKLLDAGIIFPISSSRCMMSIFGDMLEEEMEVFMDDFSVGGLSFEDCLTNLGKCLARCEKVNLVLNWEKCHFMVEEGIVLGHKISNRGIEVDKAKVEEADFVFNEECLNAFNKLKQALISTPIVQGLRWDLPFELMCDASDVAIGGVLGQRVEKRLYVIYYMSKTLNEAQRNYTTTEKEFLAVHYKKMKNRQHVKLQHY
ncbi:uncharacterized protein LOC110715818 [Chenopodium quinoa]|uniref:uncharacterized protein LOC110715818 n=1 Tax=Chenopodium quinoa TaxID=63459 RepID=UPI000B78FFE4|nr:uncharacterized protein LOC110715818 [Chenopodium quinoa]